MHGEAASRQQYEGLALHHPEKCLVNHLRKWRNGRQMIEIEVGDGAANSIAKPSKDSHDLYVSKMEAEQVRAAIQELPYTRALHIPAES
jgi:hypothetical protein